MLCSAIIGRQQTGHRFGVDQFANGAVGDVVASKFPTTLRERILRTSMCDKIFACAWISETAVITGGKDNRLIKWHIDGSKRTEEVPTLKGTTEYPSDQCGIHSIAISPGRELLATGGHNPKDVAVYSLPDMAPVAVLAGHSDWTFGCEFITDRDIVSAGRDGALYHWRLEEDEICSGEVPILKPLWSGQVHDAKARGVAHIPGHSEKVVTVGTEGMAKGSDIELSETWFSKDLGNELTCVATHMDGHLFAVGSTTHAYLCDLRTEQTVARFGAGDQWGVRSISFNNSVLTIGSGGGALVFIDIRKQQLIQPSPSHKTLKISHGPSIPESALWQQMDIVDAGLPWAVYCHAYNPTPGGGLFVGGGPLILGVSGTYAAVW